MQFYYFPRANGGDVEETRVGLEKLGVGDSLAADRTRYGKLAIVGIGGRGEKRGALRKLCGGELVEVGVGNADVDDVQTDVGNVHGEVVRDRSLDGKVPGAVPPQFSPGYFAILGVNLVSICADGAGLTGYTGP